MIRGVVRLQGARCMLFFLFVMTGGGFFLCLLWRFTLCIWHSGWHSESASAFASAFKFHHSHSQIRILQSVISYFGFLIPPPPPFLKRYQDGRDKRKKQYYPRLLYLFFFFALEKRGNTRLEHVAGKERRKEVGAKARCKVQGERCASSLDFTFFFYQSSEQKKHTSLLPKATV